MKKLWCVVALAVTLAVANSQPVSSRAPHTPNDSAKHDVDSASLVVIADVTNVEDGAPRPAPSGYRPIIVRLHVSRVLKGKSSSSQICLRYYFPYGAYDGPGFRWIVKGERGIFPLIEGPDCYRAVNDRRSVLPVYKLVKGPTSPVDAYIAQTTLPIEDHCREGVYKTAEEVSSVTLSLVGSRRTREMIAPYTSSADLQTRMCACAVMALTWRLDEDCLHSASEPEEQGLDRIAAANGRLQKREGKWFRENATVWLKMSIEGWGIDGTVLRLGWFSSHGVIDVSKDSCEAFRGDLNDPGFNASLSLGGMRSTERAERSAMIDFRRWIALGCPVPYPKFGGLPQPR
jgi:hypothetical protein